MKTLALIPLIPILFGLACSKPSTSPMVRDEPLQSVTTTDTKGAPAWIDNADREGRLTAVGIAEPNGLHNKAMQREVAVNRGLAALGKKMTVQVEALYVELQATTNHGEKKIPTVNEISNTLRNIVSVKIQGATIPYFWRDREDGTLYCLVRLSDNASQEAFQDLLHQPNLREAVQDLDKTLATRK